MESEDNDFARRYINYLWDYHGICTFENLKSNPNIDKNDVIALKMIEKFDLIDLCRRTFYKLSKEDKKKIIVNLDEDPGEDKEKEQKKSEFFRLKIKEYPSENDNIYSEIDKYKGFDEYIYFISRQYNILTKFTHTRISDSDKKYIRGIKRKKENMYMYEVCVSYVWNKDSIAEIIDLRGDMEESDRVRDSNYILWSEIMKVMKRDPKYAY